MYHGETNTVLQHVFHVLLFVKMLTILLVEIKL